MLLLRGLLFGSRLLLVLLRLRFGDSLLLRLLLLLRCLRGSLLFRLLLFILSSRRLRSRLIVVIVTAADERQCRRADAGGRSDAEKHAPRNANVGKRGQGLGHSRSWSE